MGSNRTRRAGRHLGHVATITAAAALFATAAWALGAAPSPVRAATVRALDLGQLVQAAELIIVGQARERQSRWGHRGKIIVTDVSVRVEEALKGELAPDTDIIVTRMGGSMDGVGLTVPGSAAFALGHSAVIFLRAHPATGEWRAVGMSQGVLPVDVRDGVRSVAPGGRGAELMRADENGALRPAAGALTRRLPLQDFAAEVRRLVLEQKRAH